MKQIKTSHNKVFDAEWQLLGELKLSANSTSNFSINTWLAEILSRLDLPENFLNRVLDSVQESVMRTLQQNVSKTLGQVHLSFYSPFDKLSKRKTWGFFHIERTEDRRDSVGITDHTINFYLYVEGK